ncbi:MAG TPA: DUF2807 domain-containing protein [Chitinophagaceae bacterium]
MRKELISIVTLFLLLVSLSACRKGGCLENAGNTTRVERKVAPFHQVDLYNDIDLVLTQDSVEQITVETGSNLQPNIVTEVQNGVLTIKNNATCAWLRNPAEKTTVYVTFKTLDKINYSGSGDVRSTDTLRLERLDILSDIGAGNVELTVDAGLVMAYIFNENADYILHGRADQCHTYTNARATIDFSDLTVRYYNMGYGAIKDTYINVTEQIDLEIYYKGNVYYKGEPKIKTTYHSTGRLIKAP